AVAVRRSQPRSGHPGGVARRSADLADAHRVRAAGAVHAAPEARARALLHPRGGLGLRLPDDGQLPGGLRRLRPSQARGGRRATPPAHRARCRLRPAGDPAVTIVDRVYQVAHTVLEPITRRLSLAGRVAFLTTAAVAFVLTVINVSVYVLVRQEIVGSLDDSMLQRADELVAAGYTPGNITITDARLLAIAGIQLLEIRSGGGEFLLQSTDAFPYDNREREVALGLADHSARTQVVDGVRYRVVAVQAGDGKALMLAQSMES